MSVPSQNFKNHRRIVPLYHYVTFLMITAVIVGGIVLAFKNCPENAFAGSMFAITGLTIGLVAWFARAFALRAQDRAIRAEENLRHFVLTGRQLPSELKMAQIVALRFASDAEYTALIDAAIKESLKSDGIKKRIQNWKADHNRA